MTQFLAYARHKYDCERETDAAENAVQKRLNKVVSVRRRNVDDRNAQNGAVRCDKRQIYAQRVIQARAETLDHDFDKLHERGDDENERNRLNVFDVPLNKKKVDRVSNNRRDAHNEDNRNAHTERAVGLFGHAEERTDSQKLREDKVVYEYRADNKV